MSDESDDRYRKKYLELLGELDATEKEWGELEGGLRRQVRALGLERSVVFAGFRPDLPAFLGRLDVVVHPALAEGLGLAVLEAQAAGVPVVACRAGGVSTTRRS